jgi:zinc/manganese transport system substrate-binding protein
VRRAFGAGLAVLVRAASVLAALALVAGLSACAGQQQSSGTIVVTTNILGDVVREVVGGEAQVSVLMAPGSDPHSFGVSAQQAAELERADLIVSNGLGLEEGVLRHVMNAQEHGVPTVEAGAVVKPLNYRSDNQAGRPDPHFWTDPSRMAAVVDAVADAVITQVAGVDAGTVRARAQRYTEELGELDSWMAGQFDAIPPARRQLVTNHHVFGYLAERYGFEVVGAVVPSGTMLASPSAADVEGLARVVRAARVPAIFADTAQPGRLAQVLAEEAGVGVAVRGLYSESLGHDGSGAETYLDMMRSNTRTIVDALTV